MAKKSRRARKKGRRARLSPAQMVQPGASADVAVSAPAGHVQSASQLHDLREEYRYVIADLKRIAVIAVVMLVALVALALLLPWPIERSIAAVWLLRLTESARVEDAGADMCRSIYRVKREAVPFRGWAGEAPVRTHSFPLIPQSGVPAPATDSRIGGIGYC